MLCIIAYNPLAVPLVYFLYSRGCGRHGLAVIVLHVAVMVCGRHSRSPSCIVICCRQFSTYLLQIAVESPKRQSTGG